MTAPTLTPAQAIAEARAAMELGLAEATDADARRGGWETKLIDQALTAFANAGEPFSANDIRDLLPEVNNALIGARFAAAQNTGWLRPVGLVASTKKNTHTKRINLWVRARHQEATA